MTRQIFIIIFSLFLFNCSTNKKPDIKVQEIYFREPSRESYGTYKSEILILFDNGHGLRFLDNRPIAQINSILDEKIKLINENSFEPDLGIGISKVDKVNVDFTNFILVINDPLRYNQIYKCNYKKSSQELKFKKFIIERGDTLNILEPNSDTTGIYYFKAATSTNHSANLNFPNPDKLSNRDVTTEKVGLKSILPYDQEIANYVQFKKNPVRTELFDKYKSDQFALELIERGPNGRGGEFGYSIEIVNDYAFINFASEIGKKSTFLHNRQLTSTEFKEIKDAIISSHIESAGMSFPRETNGYQCGRTQFLLKNGEKLIAGGVLSPVSISGSLARSSDNMQKIFNDCRAYSSTLKGDYDLVFTSVRKTFTQLDSLFKSLNPN